MDDCIFCNIIKGEIPAEKIYEDDNFISIFDVKPIGDGHTLVIPKKHFKTLLDIPTSLGNELLEALKETTLILMKKYKAEGFNIFMNNFEVGGQIVPHAHVHILPRKKGDGIKMAVNLNKIKDMSE
ncbi:MAG: HIT domain-containing protein [Candidatus Pacearchaeota archaeon]